MNLFILNLPYTTTEGELKSAFSAFGEIARVRIPLDRESGRPRGFGFVEMTNERDGRKAIAEMNGSVLGGREITVSEANH